MNDFDYDYVYINYVDKIFDEYNKKLANCGIDFNKLKQLSKEIVDMKESFVDSVNENCKGYLFDKGYDVLFKAKSLNEILHFLHHSIMNNENVYQNMPKLANKTNNINSDIILYGKENEVSKKIFNSFPKDLDVGQTDILSLNNKIFLMIRDKGHALSIEININEICDINYFIPKICNIIMVNNLRGVKKVDTNSKFAVGEFRENIENIDKALFDFIKQVPSDEHMFIEGGAYYERKTVYGQRNS